MTGVAQDRLTNAAFVVIASTAMCFAVFMKPSPTGTGTHEQLGLPPCRFLQVTGIPCFSCGMTTSWTHMARGHVLTALRTQPMGAVLFVATAAAGLASAVFLFKGGTVERRLRSRGKWVSLSFAGGMLASWIYKIAETLSK